MQVRTWLVSISIALVTTLGCTQRNEATVGSPTMDAGQAPVQPSDPMSQQQHPLLDAGVHADAAIGTDAGATKPMLPPNFTLECPGETASEVPNDPLSAWEAERDAHGALGRPAKLSLQGASYRVQGVGIANVRAPFTLHAGGNGGSGLVSFDGAEVEDIEEHGRLELYAGGAEPGNMPASKGAIDELALKTVVVENGVLKGTIDVTQDQVGSTGFYRANAKVEKLALEDIQQAYLYPEGTTGLDERVEWMPSEAVVLRKATSLTFYEADAGSVEKKVDQPLDLDYDAFAVAGDFTSGSLEVNDAAVPGTPVAVFGHAAQLRAGASSVEAVDGLRLTQAVNEAGLVLPAAVEIVPEMTEVWVQPSHARVVRLFYRERSYNGDAVLGEIKIGGEASELLELQTGFPPTLTGQLIDDVIDTGWAAPIAAIAVIPTVPIVFVIDVFGCIFGGCANQPPPLEPFPQWMDAGAIGTMEVRVKGDLGPGTYETTLTFVGRNYCPVTVPLTVHIGDEPAPDADGG